MAVTDHVCSELTGFNDIDVWLQKGYVREENNILADSDCFSLIFVLTNFIVGLTSVRHKLNC